MHIMFCISGFSGVGKDEFTSVLNNEYGAVQTGLVDPAKRHMADVYGFSEQQLFGPSAFRNRGDERYPKPKFHDELLFQRGDSDVYLKGLSLGEEIRLGDPAYWLSPRESLQKYCELMNELYGDTWVRKAISIHKQIGTGWFDYEKMAGLKLRVEQRQEDNIITAMADFRHRHEIAAVKALEDVRVVLIRIKSKRVPTPPYNHRSEVEQTTIPDSEFEFIVENDGTVAELHEKARNIVEAVVHSL